MPGDGGTAITKIPTAASGQRIERRSPRPPGQLPIEELQRMPALESFLLTCRISVGSVEENNIFIYCLGLKVSLKKLTSNLGLILTTSRGNYGRPVRGFTPCEVPVNRS